jgi:hypothetical protein
MNTTTGNGGGLYNAGTGTVVNSTLANNSAFAGGSGGGIFNSSGTLTAVNSTLSGNSAGIGGGGGIYNSIAGATTHLENTLLAHGASGGNCLNGSGTFGSFGHNISDDNSCVNFLGQTGDHNNVTAATAGLALAGLANNGGPTLTIALSGGTAVDAISAGSPTNDCTLADGVTPVGTDQRGVTRP